MGGAHFWFFFSLFLQLADAWEYDWMLKMCDDVWVNMDVILGEAERDKKNERIVWGRMFYENVVIIDEGRYGELNYPQTVYPTYPSGLYRAAPLNVLHPVPLTSVSSFSSAGTY
jgi:hypothetical protein